MTELEEDVRAKIYRENEDGCKPGNRAYQRYFKDFTVVRIVGKNGKPHLEHVYKGAYYKQDLCRRQKMLLRIGLIFLWVAAVMIFVICASAKLEVNRVWYVALGQAGMLLSLGWYAFCMVLYLTAPENMTEGDWKGGPKGVRKSSFSTAVLSFVAALLTLAAIVLNDACKGTEVLCVVGYTVCGGMMLLAYHLERGVDYTNTFEKSAGS